MPHTELLVLINLVDSGKELPADRRLYRAREGRLKAHLPPTPDDDIAGFFGYVKAGAPYLFPRKVAAIWRPTVLMPTS